MPKRDGRCCWKGFVDYGFLREKKRLDCSKIGFVWKVKINSEGGIQYFKTRHWVPFKTQIGVQGIFICWAATTQDSWSTVLGGQVALSCLTLNTDFQILPWLIAYKVQCMCYLLMDGVFCVLRKVVELPCVTCQKYLSVPVLLCLSSFVSGTQ